MALAYRHPDQPRAIVITPAKALSPAKHLSMFLICKNVSYKLDGFRLDERLILIENRFNGMESALLTATQQDFIGFAVVEADIPTLDDAAFPALVLLEALHFHLSFFNQFFDFARHAGIYTAPGHYTKAGSLAIFTHVYNDNAMLQVWEKYYSRVVPVRDLYVIDHGSTSSPKQVLSPEINVVSMPRGPVDHRAISQFCNTFQRFLLSQYRWVMHVDADEILVHARGWDYLKDNLLGRQDGIILKAAHGFDLVHDVASEPAIDLSAPISLQRHSLLSVPLYGKPVLTSVPTTWREGFHTVFEGDSVVEDNELWLIHLSYVDLNLYVEKRAKWARFDVAETEKRLRPALYSTLTAQVDPARQFFTRMLETRPAAIVPKWMRGTF
jgi:Glycosyl transferase family 2